MKHLIYLLAAVLGIGQGSPHTIDLISAVRSTDEEFDAIPENEDRPDTRPVVGRVADAPAPPVIPFVISAVNFDRPDYEMGDDFIVEVHLTYAGSQPITFPQSSQTHFFRRSMPGFRTATLSVAFHDPVLGRQVQVAERLYGATEVFGSLITLAPNDTVVVRTKAYWRLLVQVDTSAAVWPIQVTPSAMFNLFGTTFTHSDVSSTVNPTITLSKHKPIVTQILSDLDHLEAGVALKVPLAGLIESKEKVRSALNRATRKSGRNVATASDGAFLYVWNETP